MTEQQFYYITDQLKTFFSLYLRETKWFYFRDKIFSGNLEILFMHRNKQVVRFCSMVYLITYKCKTCFLSQNSFMLSDVHDVENILKREPF